MNKLHPAFLVVGLACAVWATFRLLTDDEKEITAVKSDIPITPVAPAPQVATPEPAAPSPAIVEAAQGD